MSPMAYQKRKVIGQPMAFYMNLHVHEFKLLPACVLCRCTNQDKTPGEFAFRLSELKPLRFRKQAIENVEEVPHMRKDRLHG